jgi:4-oxalomesaconate tautomerase
MANTSSIATAYVPTPNGTVEYEGDARIDGVPGTAAPIWIEFIDVAGSSCGALLPTGSVTEMIDDVEVTCIDNGMPVVILNAADFGLSGSESPEQLEANSMLTQRIECIRLQCGRRMNLGEVTKKTEPKMSLVSAAQAGGTLSTRTFIPHRVHEAIGVLGAVSVATACALPGSVAAKVAGSSRSDRIDIEHPTGYFTVEVAVTVTNAQVQVGKTKLLRTARKLMSGQVYISGKIWQPGVK